jgi:hypothetical protein
MEITEANRIERKDAKTQRRKGFLFFASLRLCVFALNFGSDATGPNTLNVRTQVEDLGSP